MPQTPCLFFTIQGFLAVSAAHEHINFAKDVNPSSAIFLRAYALIGFGVWLALSPTEPHRKLLGYTWRDTSTECVLVTILAPRFILR